MKKVFLLLVATFGALLSGCNNCSNCVYPTSNDPHSFVVVTYNDCQGNITSVGQLTDYQGRIITANCSSIITYYPMLT